MYELQQLRTLSIRPMRSSEPWQPGAADTGHGTSLPTSVAHRSFAAAIQPVGGLQTGPSPIQTASGLRVARAGQGLTAAAGTHSASRTNQIRIVEDGTDEVARLRLTGTQADSTQAAVRPGGNRDTSPFAADKQLRGSGGGEGGEAVADGKVGHGCVRS